MPFQIFSLALAASCAGFLIVYFLAIRSRRYLALRHVPGPSPASLTNLWLLSKMRYGRWADDCVELDRKYGPVVRYGPNRVLFSQVDSVPQIYRSTNVFPKSENYDVPVPVINGKLSPSLAIIRDEKRISAIKRQIAHAFSTTAVLDYESHIDETIQVLISNLRDSNSEVNLQQWLSFFAFDTMCRLAFSDDPGMMNRQQDVDDTLQGGRDRFMYWNHWFAIPKIEGLLYKNRFVRGITSQGVLTKMAIERVNERMEKGGAGAHQDLMDRYFQAHEKVPELFDIPTISSITLSTIHAGSETTGHTLSHVFYQLFQSPAVYERLKKECREADLSSPPKFSEVKQLPFVEACIKESQRLNQLVIFPLEHTVPPEGATICGTFVPGGTVVATNHHALALDASVYGPNPLLYNPDRWLTANDSQRTEMERASLAFSHGKRICLGLHLAWCEMLKVLPELLRRFDIELADPTYKHEVCERMIALVTNLPVTIRERKMQ